MNFTFKNIFFYALLLGVGFAISSCTEDLNEGGVDPKADIGNPTVKYIRVTDPNAADSLLVSAFMGQLIAIVGEDLGSTVELWFNDQRASLTPTYVTNETILVNVPSTVPSEVTDQIRFVFSNGDEMLYDFKVDVPAPEIDGIKCEYVEAGDIAIIYGDFYFEPLDVTFAGGAKGELVLVDKLELHVRVPADAEPGKITVSTNFGSVESGFLFRDPRGVFWNFDDLLGGGWRPGTSPEVTSNIDGVSGNYARLYAEIGGDWDWKDDFLEIDLWGQAAGRPAGPLFNGFPSEMQLKFEVNVIKEWKAGFMNLIFSPWDNAGNAVNTNNNIPKGHWVPWAEQMTPYQTDGWITVSIPLSEFKYSHDRALDNIELNYPDGCGSLSVFVFGPTLDGEPNDVEMWVDNFRVVPL